MVWKPIKYTDDNGDTMKCSVFAPSHITGFFEIVDHPNPLKMGSRGAGVALEAGVTTDVEIKSGRGVDVKINGKNDPRNASITYKTIDLIKKQFKTQELNDKINFSGFDDTSSKNAVEKLTDKKIVIEHRVDVPIGAGFGTSAAFALGTSLGLAKILEMPVTHNKAASIAHLAELEMGSGLGDVIAEICGGIVLRLREGAPGIGAVDKILKDDGLFVISKTLGKIDTSSVIKDPFYKEMINRTGQSLLFELLKNPDPSFFMRLSRKFSQQTELMNSEVLEVVEVLEDETLGASMAMLGNTAFALSKSPDAGVEGALISKIDSCGCRFVKNRD